MCPPQRDKWGCWPASTPIETFDCAIWASAVRPGRGFREIPSLTAHTKPSAHTRVWRLALYVFGDAWPSLLAANVAAWFVIPDWM
jgi:hypothetical protein